MKTNYKVSHFSRFLPRSENANLVKICKWQKLLNSVPSIKTTLVNQVFIRIWSFWLTYTALQWIKTNYKISQFSRFLLKSEYAILVNILKMTKTSYFVPSVKKTLVNQVFIRIWSFWLTYTALQWIKTNLKISLFEDFC